MTKKSWVQTFQQFDFLMQHVDKGIVTAVIGELQVCIRYDLILNNSKNF
jgi:hypothetical protein